jgi:hypothetical protein
MGQYYVVVNEDRQEYLSPENLGCGRKLWELCANDLPRVLPYLLQQSSELGGGDPRNQETDHLGRWAGDRIVVVGDYDNSGLYQIAESVYAEISDEIRPEVNEFFPSQYRLDDSIYGRHGLDDSFPSSRG